MQPKPGRLFDEVHLTQSRPRDKTSPAFEAAVRRVLAALDRSLRDERPPAGPDRDNAAAALWW